MSNQPQGFEASKTEALVLCQRKQYEDMRQGREGFCFIILCLQTNQTEPFIANDYYYCESQSYFEKSPRS